MGWNLKTKKDIVHICMDPAFKASIVKAAFGSMIMFNGALIQKDNVLRDYLFIIVHICTCVMVTHLLVSLQCLTHVMRE